MSHIRFRLGALVIATVGFSAIALPALAETHAISGTHTKEEINKACDAVGGTQVQGAGGKGYGCFNGDKGTMVACSDNGVCTGYTPGRIKVPTNLRHFMNLQIPPVATFQADDSPAGNGISKGGAPAPGAPAYTGPAFL
jgi:hypothetical protein